MTFDKIATALLHQYGYEILPCKSDAEAIDKAIALKNGSSLYPVHFTCSDTSGEKGYEEFYIENESVDLNRLEALGIVTNKLIPDKEKINILFKDLNDAFNKEKTTKEEVVAIMETYLPNFRHIETGKSLDSKM